MSIKDTIQKLEEEKRKVDEKLMDHFRKEVSEEMKKKILEYKDLVDPFVLKKVFGIKVAKSSDAGAVRPTKKLSEKASRTPRDITPKEAFFNTISQKSSKLKKGDHLANIGAKILLFMVKQREENNLMSELARNFQKAKEEEINERHDNTIGKLYKRELNNKRQEERNTRKGKSSLLKTGIVGAVGVGLLLFAEDAHATFSDMKKKFDMLTTDIKDLLQKPPKEAISANLGDVSSLKDIIGKVESGGNYNQLVLPKSGPMPEEFKGIDLSKLSLTQVQDLQSKMKQSGKFPSQALGKYQITPDTLKHLITKFKIDPNEKFTPELQDKLADDLIEEAGGSKFKAGIIDTNEFQTNLAKTWAAIPVPTDMSVKDNFGQRNLKAGQSYYTGVGGNKAANIQAPLTTAISGMRGSTATQVSNVSTAGQNVVAKSRDFIEEEGDKYIPIIVNRATVLPIGQVNSFIRDKVAFDDKATMVREYFGR